MGAFVDREPAHQFQEQELRKLSALPYSELEKLLGRVDISSPVGLEAFQFAREVTRGPRGHLEVSVFHYWVPRVPPRLVAGFEVVVGECKSRRWFWIKRNNKIEWPDLEHDPDD